MGGRLVFGMRDGLKTYPYLLPFLKFILDCEGGGGVLEPLLEETSISLGKKSNSKFIGSY
jgi:hypothetical protein